MNVLSFTSLKYGFLKNYFNHECTYVSLPFPVITFGWV